MARYIAWIGERGTIKATSLHPYLKAVIGFFKDHGAEPVAQGDLVAKVRRGLAAS
jgi:ADP-heptose:LPS heptosyltransferase